MSRQPALTADEQKSCPIRPYGLTMIAIRRYFLGKMPFDTHALVFSA